MKNIAVFASGAGSNFAQICRYFREVAPDLGRVRLLICDRPQAQVIERAETWNIPYWVASPGGFSDKKHYEADILAQLTAAHIDLIALAGYMRLIGDTLLNPFFGRIVNIHPSLLPAFPGLDAVGQALQAGVWVSGVTVHFVDSGMDTGPILYQMPIALQRDDTHATLSERIHQVEHYLYPRLIAAVLEGKAWLSAEGKVLWKEDPTYLFAGRKGNR